jgi:hypothetical protein
MKRCALGLAMLALACSGGSPRHGEVTLNARAPSATLAGTTSGEAPALELAPGCAGFLDPEQPSHLLHVEGALAVRLRATSDAGPLALVVVDDDEVRCDADGGTGHAPTITLTGPGTFAVHVASLRGPAALRYALTVSRPTEGADAPAAEPAAASDVTRDVSVTITSSPSGATVLDEAGRALGTTPQMFVVSVPPGEAPRERRWTLSLAGFGSAIVQGSSAAPALILHAELAPDPAARDTAAPSPTAASELAPAERGENEPANEPAESASRQPRPPPRPTLRPRDPAPAPAGAAPDLPPHQQITGVLAGLRPTIAARCAGPPGQVRVYFTLLGATGAVRSLSVSGTASGEQQTCVANLVRRARFPRFRRGSLDVDYTYTLSTRLPQPPPFP